MDNNDLQGLEVYQLYELMEPLADPEPVSMMPQGPGWWLVAAAVLVLVLAALTFWLCRRHKNRFRHYAILEIDALPPDYNPLQVSAILKRCLMTQVPRQQVASLTGQQWCDYLNNCVANKVQFHDFYFLTDAFDREQLRRDAKYWLTHYKVAA